MHLQQSIYFQPVTEREDATFTCSVIVTKNITFAWYVDKQKQDGQNGKEFTKKNITRSLNVTCVVLLNGAAMKNTTKTVDLYCKFFCVIFLFVLLNFICKKGWNAVI